MEVVDYLLGKKAGGGSGSILQTKNVTITENGTTEINPDTGYDGMSKVNLTTNIPSQKYAPRYIRFSNYTGTDLTYEINNLDISNITDMTQFFSNCNNLISIPDISNWDTSNVNSMYYMFHGCIQIRSLDLSSFDISNVTNMNYMFNQCLNLNYLDIRNMVFSTKGEQFTYINLFGSANNTYVPANCLIIVKDSTEKTWINTNFPRMTNVKTVAEYESS